MRILWLGALLGASASAAGTQTGSRPAVQVINVNSRYDVESIEITGEGEFALSQRLHDDIQQMIGAKLDVGALDALAERIRVELHAKSVKHRLSRGQLPDHVRVVFEVTRHRVDFDLSLPRFLYHSKQGWTGEVDSAITYFDTTVGFGLVSDSDELPERNAGIHARFEQRQLGTRRLQLRFRFEDFHQQWNRTTLAALEAHPEVPGIYRTRRNVQPTVAIVLARPLTLETGFSFQRIETQFPAARFEASNAVVNTLRYHRQWEDSDSGTQVLDAGYNLRAATKALAGDFVYTRHRFDAGYSLKRGHQMLLARCLAGAVTGRPPLYERFVLGNSGTLRGWSKFDVAPLGGNRVAHGSLEYRIRFLQLFYDTGAVWNRGESPDVKHAAGFGLRKDSLFFTVAFPIRENRVEPIFMAGMNF